MLWLKTVELEKDFILEFHLNARQRYASLYQ